jgi:hypothetical protein
MRQHGVLVQAPDDLCAMQLTGRSWHTLITGSRFLVGREFVNLHRPW